MGKLGVDYLDLLILHQPAPDRFDKTIAAYKALGTLLADGRVRAIGASNFMPHHLKQLLDSTDIIPAVNQIELHGEDRRNVMEDPDNRRQRADLRQKPRAGHAPLAPAAGPLNHPQINQPDTGIRTGPDPDEAREERFALVIPEA